MCDYDEDCVPFNKFELVYMLDKILGRSLGRQVSGDEKEAPQHRRPTTSTHRQWAVTVVAEDVENMDNVANVSHEEPYDSVIENVGGDSQDFPSGP